MNQALSFDDVLISPKFSFVNSRKDIDTSVNLFGISYELGIISANMASVTESDMSIAMHNNGAIGCLHRFCSIEDNLNHWRKSSKNSWCSLGISKNELERAQALFDEGCAIFLVDVANGAQQKAVGFVHQLKEILKGNAAIVIGNFATAISLKDFEEKVKFCEGYKLGIGSGSNCQTRVVTGCGIPTLQSIIDCREVTDKVLIADGGIKNSGDVAKCFAAGADAVMVGRMLAGTDESPGKKYVVPNKLADYYKVYSGSASQESYNVQNKNSYWRTPEGITTTVPYVGPVKDVLQKIDAGLRSAMSYVNAFNMEQFKENSEFVQITQNGLRESYPHGET